MNILIVKTSSLGDIIQSFPVLSFLKKLFPNSRINWVVEQKLASIVASHPLVHQAILMDREKIFSSIIEFRKISYDFVFDLQGNSKAALITFFSKGTIKVGFDFKSVREWPNLFATHFRFHVSSQLNIRLQYLSLISQFFSVPLAESNESVLLKMDDLEVNQWRALKESEPCLKERGIVLEGASPLPNSEVNNPALKNGVFFNLDKKFCQIMVCPGSQWDNKQLSLEVMISFLSLIQKKYGAFFFLMWGNNKEKIFCEKIQEVFIDQSKVIEKLPLSIWQNLMNEMHLVIAVDSSALHLCGITGASSFSIFGPTSPSIFKPIGEQHFAVQGKCPYGKIFDKRCPILRTCPTGACIKNLTPEELFQAFSIWWDARSSFLRNPP